MAPDGEYRIGINATTLPEAICIDLATARYVFADLSGLNPGSVMHLEVVRKAGKPWIQRLDAPGGSEGFERNYLTPSNLADAIDKDALATCSSAMDVVELVERHVGDGRKRHEAIDVAETADGKEIIFTENDGWGETLRFPVRWLRRHGIGCTPEEGNHNAVVTVRFRLDAENQVGVLEELLGDLRRDGYRPARFIMNSAELTSPGEEFDVTTEEIDFREDDGGIDSTHDRIMASIAVGYDKLLVKGAIAFVEHDALAKAKGGEKDFRTRAVLCSFSNGTFEAAFMAEGAHLLE
ncbi:MAG: hypothetical protein LBJ46_11625 [Planctomycetota bacterium]|nr:hypothetical protein [Planctomycetota bacterium]